MTREGDRLQRPARAASFRSIARAGQVAAALLELWAARRQRIGAPRFLAIPFGSGDGEARGVAELRRPLPRQIVTANLNEPALVVGKVIKTPARVCLGLAHGVLLGQHRAVVVQMSSQRQAPDGAPCAWLSDLSCLSCSLLEMLERCDSRDALRKRLIGSGLSVAPGPCSP